jgi:hypothetical protein
VTEEKVEKGKTEAIAGTWKYEPDLGQLMPTILAVKAGNAFIVLFIAGLTEGTWSTVGLLGSAGVSHLSFYDGAGGGPAPDPTPLPAAVWLFGSIVAGYGGFSRWRKRKAEALAVPA